MSYHNYPDTENEISCQTTLQFLEFRLKMTQRLQVNLLICENVTNAAENASQNLLLGFFETSPELSGEAPKP